MVLNARDEVVAEGSKITVNGVIVKVSIFHGYALRGLAIHRHSLTHLLSRSVNQSISPFCNQDNTLHTSIAEYTLEKHNAH